jgi:hypothetical protein
MKSHIQPMHHEFIASPAPKLNGIVFSNRTQQIWVNNDSAKAAGRITKIMVLRFGIRQMMNKVGFANTSHANQ